MRDLQLENKLRKSPAEKQELKNAKKVWKQDMRDKNLDPKRVLKSDKNLSSLQ
jgi:hypothetical protein